MGGKSEPMHFFFTRWRGGKKKKGKIDIQRVDACSSCAGKKGKREKEHGP